MIAKFLAIAAAGVSIASAACTYPPTGTQLAGNAVTRPDLTHFPTIGEPFDIVWDATGLSSTVSLMLLRGPGENILFLENIVTGTANTGTFSWTPEDTLTPDTTHYGIILFDDATCSYQFTSQFGINAGAGTKSSTSTSSAPTSSSTAPPKSSSTTTASSSGSAPPPPKTLTSTYGGWGSNGTSTSTSTYYPPAGTGNPAPSGTYKPIQSNDARRFGMSLVGVACALAAAVMIL